MKTEFQIWLEKNCDDGDKIIIFRNSISEYYDFQVETISLVNLRNKAVYSFSDIRDSKSEK